jgi:hypothetical protein
LVALPNGYGPLQFGLRWGEDPHNVFLNAFASYGWLGGFTYLLLIMSTIIGMWQSVFSKTPWQHHSIAVNSVMLMTILQGVQIDTDHWRHFYTLLGLSWGLYAATLGWQASKRNERIHPSRKWSERRDSNPRPLVPQTSALPGCATLRL